MIPGRWFPRAVLVACTLVACPSPSYSQCYTEGLSTFPPFGTGIISVYSQGFPSLQPISAAMGIWNNGCGRNAPRTPDPYPAFVFGGSCYYCINISSCRGMLHNRTLRRASIPTALGMPVVRPSSYGPSQAIHRFPTTGRTLTSLSGSWRMSSDMPWAWATAIAHGT